MNPTTRDEQLWLHELWSEALAAESEWYSWLIEFNPNFVLQERYDD